MKKLLPIICFVVLIVLSSCGSKSSQNSAEEYRKYYQVSLDACVRVMIENNVDSLVAVEKCSCCLDHLYEMDSTYFQKSKAEMHAFLNENREKVEMLCDSIR